MPVNKIQAIDDFITGLAEIRLAVKEDAKKIIENIPVKILLDEVALAEFLEEMALELSRKHLITENRKIVAAPAKLIKDYANKMAVIADD